MRKPLYLSPAPYFVSQYVPGELVVIERNRFYRGSRPHHVDRITIELDADASALERVEKGELDSLAGTPNLNPQLADLVKRHGINRSRVFLSPDTLVRSFYVNTTRPLFRNNVQLRQALNFAVDRLAVGREYGRYAATPTDQYIPPILPGFPPRTHLPPQRSGTSASTIARTRPPALGQSCSLHV